MSSIVVAALYHFVPIDDCKKLQDELYDLQNRIGLKGTLLIAPEGINGTVSGTRDSIDALIKFFKEDGRFDGWEYKESCTQNFPFYRLKIKIKKEIVTMGVESLNPNTEKGHYVTPHEWNQLIQDPNTIVIDTRNDYEAQIGSFERAINPKTTCFREFPDYVQQHIMDKKDAKIAMYCTGGIRCEKSTAYLKTLGFKEVYHLKGGILRYLEEIPPQDSLWKGECFVFDQRTSLGHGLSQGTYDKCFGCRMPICEEDKKSVYYVEGSKCHHCHHKYQEKHYKAAQERQNQMMLAKKNDRRHLGSFHDVRAHKETLINQGC
jgi:UPF0176 protein